MTIKPSVSLLVPCYNAEAYILDFIENISKQTVPFDEIIFYDDASTDNTAKLLREQNIGHVISGHSNKGPSFGRNIMLRESTGQLIHFHDIDDWMEPDFLEQTLKCLIDGCDVVLTNIRVMDRETGETIHIHDYTELNNSNDLTEYFLTHCGYAIHGLYRRESLEKINGYREALSRDEDPDLHIRLANSGAKIRSVPSPLVINRVGSNTYSATSFVACWREHLKALQFYLEELPNKYQPILRKNGAAMIGLCAAEGDLELAYKYLDFCESIGGEEEIWDATSKPIKLLSTILGYRNALNLRFGLIGSGLRKLYPGRIG